MLKSGDCKGQLIHFSLLVAQYCLVKAAWYTKTLPSNKYLVLGKWWAMACNTLFSRMSICFCVFMLPSTLARVLTALQQMHPHTITFTGHFSCLLTESRFQPLGFPPFINLLILTYKHLTLSRKACTFTKIIYSLPTLPSAPRNSVFPVHLHHYPLSITPLLNYESSVVFSLFLAHLSTKCSWWAIVVSQCPSCVVRRPSCGVNNCFKSLLLLHPWANWLDTW